MSDEQSTSDPVAGPHSTHGWWIGPGDPPPAGAEPRVPRDTVDSFCGGPDGCDDCAAERERYALSLGLARTASEDGAYGGDEEDQDEPTARYPYVIYAYKFNGGNAGWFPVGRSTARHRPSPGDVVGEKNCRTTWRVDGVFGHMLYAMMEETQRPIMRRNWTVWTNADHYRGLAVLTTYPVPGNVVAVEGTTALFTVNRVEHRGRETQLYCTPVTVLYAANLAPDYSNKRR